MTTDPQEQRLADLAKEPVETIRHVMELAQDTWEVGLLEHGFKLQCEGRGCHYCCTGDKLALEEEVERILDALSPRDWKRARALAPGILAGTVKRCPLINPRMNRCATYSERPLHCRALGATSAAARCKKGTPHLIHHPLWLIMQRYFAEADRALVPLGTAIAQAVLERPAPQRRRR
jgi:Fe-S-cluster containining protein